MPGAELGGDGAFTLGVGVGAGGGTIAFQVAAAGLLGTQGQPGLLQIASQRFGGCPCFGGVAAGAVDLGEHGVAYGEGGGALGVGGRQPANTPKGTYGGVTLSHAEANRAQHSP